jgi:DNA ligase-4
MEMDSATALGSAQVDAAGEITGPSSLPAYKTMCFADLCELFEAIQGVSKSGPKGANKKRKLLNDFHAEFGVVNQPRTDAYDMYRLILPAVDKDRAAYGLKEGRLGRIVGLALGLKPGVGGSPDFHELEGWKSSGKGTFAQTVYDVCSKHMRPNLGDVRHATIGDVNNALDKLSELNAKDNKVG